MRRHPLRTGLTVLGVVVGVAAFVVVFAIGEGARHQVLERIHSLGGNLLVVQPGSARRGGVDLGVGSQPSLDLGDAEAIAHEIEGVELTAPSVFGRLQAVRGHRNRLTTAQGITADYLRAREWGVAAGRPFSAHDLDTRRKVALLGASVAEALFPGLDPVGERLRLGGVPLTVVGVLEAKGQSAGGADQDDKVMVPLSTAMTRVLGAGPLDRGELGYIMVKVDDGRPVGTVVEDVRALLRQRHRLPPRAPDDFTLSDLTEVQRRKAEASEVLRLWLTLVASVSLVVGAISVANIMLVAVAERTREIGLRLAVGARPRDIRNQFLVEATALTLAGGLLGVLCGAAGAWVLTGWAGLPTLISPVAVLLALGAATATGVIAGVIPAVKAATLSPIEALRSG